MSILLIVPSPPINVTVVRVGDKTVLVSWMPPLEPNGLITLYELMYAGYLVSNTSDMIEVLRYVLCQKYHVLTESFSP